MSFRISLALLLLLLLACRDQSPTPQIWLQWCAAEWETYEIQKPIDLSALRESFVTACNQSLAEQLNMTVAEFTELNPKCGFSYSGDTIIWLGFFPDSTLKLQLAPNFKGLGADTTLAISNYESCFYRTLDMCFSALSIVRNRDTTVLDLPFHLRP